MSTSFGDVKKHRTRWPMPMPNDADGDRHGTDGCGLLRKVDSYVGHSLPLAVYSSRIPTGDQTRRTTFARFSWAHSNVWRTHFRTGQKSIPALARVR